MIKNVQKALKNKWGINFDGVKRNTSADFMRQPRPLTPIERAAMMRSVDKVYETFTENVAMGRNMPIEKVLEIAGGRVWTGEDALEIGLVDTNTGLKGAIAVAADKAGLGDDFRVTEQIEEPTGFMAFFSQLQAKVVADFNAWTTQSAFGSMVNEYESIKQDLRPVMTEKGVVMHSPVKVDFK